MEADSMDLSGKLTTHPLLRMMTSITLILVSRLAIWHRNHQTRIRLAALNPQQLADIGLSSPQQSTECTKWFWQP